MKSTSKSLQIAQWLAGGVALASASYGASIAATWYRYGRVRRPSAPDALLDAFMPTYDVAERHEIAVAAPPDTTFAAACRVNLEESLLVRGLFRAREMVLGGASEPAPHPSASSLVDRAKAIGWGVLAESPGREIVLGAVTQPWVSQPEFRAIEADEFAAFAEPGYVKIAWTISVRGSGSTSIARTETRATTTDAAARTRFRRYWACVRPGVVLIRYSLLGGIKVEAERRARAEEHATPSTIAVT